MPFQNLSECAYLTIGSGGSISGSVNVGGGVLAGIGYTGTWTAAILTFETSFGAVPPHDGGTWVRVVSRTTAGFLSVPAGSMALGTAFHVFSPNDAACLQWVRVWSGTAGAGGTVQTADRTLGLVYRPF